MKRYNKYKNVKTEIDGIIFDSKKEARHYSNLKMMMKCGRINFFDVKVKYEIARIGKRTRSYIADFVVTNNDGSVEVHDVKGVKTPVYNLKKFLMEERHGIKIVEI